VAERLDWKGLKKHTYILLLYGVIFSCYAHTQTYISVAIRVIKLSHVLINYSVKPEAPGEKHNETKSGI
jgi:hypothetical protein